LRVFVCDGETLERSLSHCEQLLDGTWQLDASPSAELLQEAKSIFCLKCIDMEFLRYPKRAWLGSRH